jgi:dipeptidyl aminopeptidase/acylaminoacyl peptidase
MRRILLAALACAALLASVAFGSNSSPTGRIVFLRDLLCQKQIDCGLGEIAVIDADGSGLRVLTHDKVTETSPEWSPDGRQIAFIRPKAHTSDQIWVMNADGTHQRGLTRLRRGPQLFGDTGTPDLSWSPDGRQLVFAAWPTNQGGVEQLYLLNVRTHSVRRLTHLSTGARNPAWAPNGRWIAFLGNAAPDRIFLLSPRTRHVHQLAYHGGPVGGLGLAWSADSRRLAFNQGGKIHVLDADGTHFRSLDVWGDDPSWSPDGKWIVFDAAANKENLAEIRPDGSGYHLITHLTSKRLAVEPDW